MKTSTRLALPFFYALIMGACSSNNDEKEPDEAYISTSPPADKDAKFTETSTCLQKK